MSIATKFYFILVNKVESGEVSFFDSGLRRFWSNLLVNGFFFFGIALGALFFLALHYATESGWGVVLLRVTEGIMTAMPIGMGVLVVVFIAGSLGIHHIYPWMDSDLLNPNSSHFDPIIYGKKAYLNIPFFWIRVAAYFTTFVLFLRWFKKKSRQDYVDETFLDWNLPEMDDEDYDPLFAYGYGLSYKDTVNLPNYAEEKPFIQLDKIMFFAGSALPPNNEFIIEDKKYSKVLPFFLCVGIVGAGEHGNHHGNYSTLMEKSF